jgi:hypothetical protein
VFLGDALSLEGARTKGFLVVLVARPDGLSKCSIAREDEERIGRCELRLSPNCLLCRFASTEIEPRPRDEGLDEGISLATVGTEAPSLGDCPPILLTWARIEDLGVPGRESVRSFSPISSLCLSNFRLNSSHALLIASLSNSEKGRGGCLRTLAELPAGGGRGESGSSMASGEE